MIQLYKVGGCVRDEIMGRKPKDIDYAVEAPSYESMRDWIAERGTIWQERPQFQTVRAKVSGVDADFVLCRKDGAYSDGRRPDEVTPGDISDDLARRDFTMNAIAMRNDGSYFDPHSGRSDIDSRVIRTVGRAEDRFGEDALRLLRAMRFSITLGFDLHDDVRSCFDELGLLEKLRSVSIERQQIELQKCFYANTPKSLNFLANYVRMKDYLFDNSILWLEPTLKVR